MHSGRETGIVSAGASAPEGGKPTVYKLLLVEDDPGIAEAIREHAAQWEMEVCLTEDFRHVMEQFAQVQPHLVLLDIALPFYSGYYWCQEIRKVSTAPVIFISSAADNMNIVLAMNLGADDFIAKPFDFTVLSAKITAILRRAYDYTGITPRLSHKGATLDPDTLSLVWQKNPIPLTKNEYRILETLMREGGIVSRDTLMERLWETDSFVDENTLNVNVARLRKKLEGAGLSEYIVTKKGVGYGLA